MLNNSQKNELNFKVKLLTDQKDQEKILKLRSLSYKSHNYNASWAESMSKPDFFDLNGAYNLLVLDKVTDELLGALRVSCNKDFNIETHFSNYFDISFYIKNLNFAYLDRFVVKQGASAEVSLALIKSSWLFCRAKGVDFVMALARAPLAKKYKRFGGLLNIGPSEGISIPEYHVDPYFLIGCQIFEGEAYIKNTLPNFSESFCNVTHPDIDLVPPAIKFKNTND